MIVVVGATGLVGSRITRELLQSRQDVRILVRPNSGYRALAAEGAQPVIGDLKEPASLPAAFEGVDTVITTASAGSRGGADTPQTVDLEGNRHLIDTARQNGVRQFIFVSALSADEASPLALAQAKAKSEAYLRASGLVYTILAPNGIMDVMLPLIVGRPALEQRPVTLVGEGTRRHSWVAARDVAAFAVAAIGHPAALNQRLIIGGAEAVSWRDIVASYEGVLGRPITVQTVAPGQLLPDLPPAPGLAEFLSGAMAELETYDSPIEMGELARTFGVRLTPLDDFVRCEVASAAVKEVPMPEQNKQVARRFIQAFMTGDTALLEEVVTEDVVDHNPIFADQKPGRPVLAGIIAMYRTAFPDMEITIEREVAEGDYVVQYGKIKGTNKGEMMGLPATNRRVTFAWMDMHRIAGGQIAESWHLEDIAGLMRQLGLT